MISQRTTATALLAAAILAASAAAAAAHSDVTSTSPARGTTAKTSIDRVTVTFGGPLRRGTVRVVGPGGKVVSAGKGGRDPRRISRLLVALNGGLKPGAYKASWAMVAADGHDQRGSFRFRLKR